MQPNRTSRHMHWPLAVIIMKFAITFLLIIIVLISYGKSKKFIGTYSDCKKKYSFQHQRILWIIFSGTCFTCIQYQPSYWICSCLYQTCGADSKEYHNPSRPPQFKIDRNPKIVHPTFRIAWTLVRSHENLPRTEAVHEISLRERDFKRDFPRTISRSGQNHFLPFT